MGGIGHEEEQSLLEEQPGNGFTVGRQTPGMHYPVLRFTQWSRDDFHRETGAHSRKSALCNFLP